MPLTLLVLLAPLGLEFALPAMHAGMRQQQVRIEQRTVIRIGPPGMVRRHPAEENERPRRYRERKIGGCVPMAGIAAVRVEDEENLLLIMRDRALIGGRVGKTCQTRDFYLGFYVERSGDGQLCVDRDLLRSRNGASCPLTRLRRLTVREPSGR